MKKKTIKTVTVGIPIYNEAGTIQGLIKSIAKQKEVGVKIERIIVICDGTTDRGNLIVEEMADKDEKIMLIDDGMRLGKAERINQMAGLAESDILIIFDGDVVLGNEEVVSKMAQKFNHYNVGIVAGKSKPIDGGNWWRKLTGMGALVWLSIREGIRGGNNVHNLSGCIFGLSRIFYKNLKIPVQVVLDDEYIYLEAKRQGFWFRYQPQAIAYYLTAASLDDFVKQASRSISGREEMATYFGEEVRGLYQIPLQHKIWTVTKYWFDHPVITTGAIFLEVLVRIKLRWSGEGEEEINNLWPRISSTKK